VLADLSQLLVFLAAFRVFQELDLFFNALLFFFVAEHFRVLDALVELTDALSFLGTVLAPNLDLLD